MEFCVAGVGCCFLFYFFTVRETLAVFLRLIICDICESVISHVVKFTRLVLELFFSPAAAAEELQPLVTGIQTKP